MEITSVGANGFRIKTKNALATIDNGIVLLDGDKPFKIDTPGEFEVGGVSVIGINDTSSAKIYVLELDHLRLAYLGRLSGKLTEAQIEDLGSIDILILPDLNQEVVAQVDPWVVLTEKAPDGTVALPKYVVTSDKLPTELSLFVLERK